MQTGGFLPPDVIVYGVLRGHRMGWRSEMYSHHFIQWKKSIQNRS